VQPTDARDEAYQAPRSAPPKAQVQARQVADDDDDDDDVCDDAAPNHCDGLLFSWLCDTLGMNRRWR
jgi:hypothetical protein